MTGIPLLRSDLAQWTRVLCFLKTTGSVVTINLENGSFSQICSSYQECPIQPRQMSKEGTLLVLFLVHIRNNFVRHGLSPNLPLLPKGIPQHNVLLLHARDQCGTRGESQHCNGAHPAPLPPCTRRTSGRKPRPVVQDMSYAPRCDHESTDIAGMTHDSIGSVRNEMVVPANG